MAHWLSISTIIPILYFIFLAAVVFVVGGSGDYGMVAVKKNLGWAKYSTEQDWPLLKLVKLVKQIWEWRERNDEKLQAKKRKKNWIIHCTALVIHARQWSICWKCQRKRKLKMKKGIRKEREEDWVNEWVEERGETNLFE